MKFYFILLITFCSVTSFAEVDFAKEVRPILSEYCFHCHGPDEESREGKLRLDTIKGVEGAFRIRKKRAAIVPGKISASHVYLRIMTDDEDDIMPPLKSKKKMNPAEKEIIKKWIEEGAKYQGHWAFDVPKQAPLPRVKKKNWVKNEIDSYILAELEKNNMTPAEEASKATLVRRLYLDLMGLPPSTAAIDAFVGGAITYEKLVDKLLASPSHAERLTVDWLDVARYADTNGYSIDDHRDMWAWRDWVIHAYMKNMPYDQFLTEQLAGDILAKMNTSPSIKKVKPVKVTRPKLSKAPFWIWKKGKIKTEAVNFKKTFALKKKPAKALLRATCDNNLKLKVNGVHVAGSDHWQKPVSIDVAKFLKVGQNEILAEAGNEGETAGLVMALQIGKFSIISDKSWLAQVSKGKWQAVTEISKYGSAPWGKILNIPATPAKPKYSIEKTQQLVATGFLRNSMNTHEGGTIAEEYRVQYHVDKVDTVSTAFMGLTVKCAQCHDHKFDPISQKDFYSVFAFFNSSSEPGKGATNANTKPLIAVNSLLTPKAKMIKAYQMRIAELEKAKKNLGRTKSKLQGFSSKITIKTIDEEIKVIKRQIVAGKTSVMVMDHRANTKTHVLVRGQYNVKGDEVQPRALEQILPFKNYPKNRLGLAQWLLDDQNPLTARVAVNRFWNIIFGTGIVKTLEDFGSQGEFPSHQKLLDYLAVEFRQNKWNIRKLIKKMVMSATYRQSSNVNPKYVTRDPYNRLFSRAPTFRLSAEFLRDNALFIAGILSDEVGGPGVYPAQPEGLWAQVSHFGYGRPFTAQAYFESFGESLYRRSMYTVTKRTAVHPSMAAFDAPSREVCTARRLQTNTPLQSLIVMNDPQFVNAARFLALRMKSKSSDVKDRLAFGFKLATGRTPVNQETEILKAAYLEQLKYYKSNKGEVKKLLLKEGDAVDAALMMLASTILNLSETMTRN